MNTLWQLTVATGGLAPLLALALLAILGLALAQVLKGPRRP